jgi:microcystin-dependent protein
MAQPYVGEIRMFGGNFAPAGWIFCEGQLLPISENETLFQLIGTTYGGDGQSTFALPDLRGRLPIHQGNGFILAENGGAEQITLTVNQIPSHSHPALGSSNTGTGTAPQGNVLSSLTVATNSAYGSDNPQISISPQSVTMVGGSQPHSNMQPFLCVDFIISLFGIFPSPT